MFRLVWVCLVLLLGNVECELGSEATTPWGFKLVTKNPQSFWFPTEFYQDYVLGDPDPTGALPLLALDKKNRTRPICDDSWQDYEAMELCKIYGYTRGRRASFTTDGKYLLTQLRCYYFRSYDASYMAADQDCKVEEYDSKESLPCRKDQGAALYCYDERWIPTQIRYTEITTTRKKFTVKLHIGSSKYGKFYDKSGKESLDKMPSRKDFTAEACDKNIKINVKIAKSGEVKITGKFPKISDETGKKSKKTTCSECVVFIIGEESIGKDFLKHNDIASEGICIKTGKQKQRIAYS